MSATSAGSAAGRMRASDADRDATLAQLSEQFQAGRLTQDEFEERSGQALTARTMGELGDLMTDLPCPAVSGRVRPVSGPPVSGPPVSGSAGFHPTGFDPTGSDRTGLDPAAGAPPVPWVRPALVPVIVVLAVLGSVVTLGTHHHGWTFWWIIPLVLIVARRLAGRRMAGRPGPGPFGQR
ncbi:MAG TPA: DUF1707 domain-containing protein [Streptosporangiaceae bacterium]|jgi:hypothetical protein|nr:DUF1707 domain-containing protein [Streptosporangiaceae bacterium]